MPEPTSTKPQTNGEPAGASDPERDGARLHACDRVLLYVRGMDVDPLTGLEYALDSLRRADPQSGPAGAMRALHDLLRENGLSAGLADADGQLLRSMPPMNRRPMVAEEMDRLPLLTFVRRLLGKPADPPDTGRGQ